MNLLTKTLNKIFKTSNQQELDRIKPLINKINSQESNISSLKDDVLGEKLILIIESKKYKFNESIFNSLNKFEKPKEVYFINKFIYTKSKKIDRINTKLTIK